MNELVARRVLRGIGVAIAIAAVVDPPWTSSRSVKPVVVVSALDSIRDASLADRVARTVNRQFTVARSPIAGASAAVVVGDGLPSDRDEYPTPTFAVAPDSTSPGVAIDRIEIPSVVPSDARVPVTVDVVVHGARGRSLEVTLRAGASVADRLTRRFSREDSVLTVPLSFVPTAIGATTVRVTATLSGVGQSAVADAAVDVRDQRWAVLFFDPRPSWTSTFVRRAVERDPRFVTTSRVVTSRNVSTDAGRPPRLDDLIALSLFDAVVVGAPEGLSPADVAGLDGFMRRRGGSVVLLLDQRVTGAYDRLTNVATWGSSNTSSTTLSATRNDSTTLRATDIAWPSVLPAGAMAIAGGDRPVVWQSPVGAGRLIVSGALDAWRFRDPSSSEFDRFWRTTIAEAASAAPPPVSIDVSTPIAKGGELVQFNATIRDAALRPAFTNVANTAPVRASIAATLESQQPAASSQQPIRLWPAADVGQFSGTFRAPRTPGTYRIRVVGNATTADAPLIVAADVRRASPNASELLGPWTASRGGRVFRASDVEQMPAVLTAAIRPASRLETWRPMRSAWWIVPFVLVLSGEWWLRRRRGLR